MHVQAHTYTHTHMHAQLHTHTHTRTHKHTHTRTHMYALTPHHTHTHKHTHTHTHRNTHMQDHMRAHTERKECSFNLTSLLGHTSAESKKLGTGMHATEDGICHNILTTTRQHPLRSAYIVLFLDNAAIPKKKMCYLSMASLCCHQKWSVAPLHRK